MRLVLIHVNIGAQGERKLWMRYFYIARRTAASWRYESLCRALSAQWKMKFCLPDMRIFGGKGIPAE